VAATPLPYPTSVCGSHKRGEGRNRTRKLYRPEPNTFWFRAYYILILKVFKPFLGSAISWIALSTPIHCPVVALPLLARWNFRCNFMPSSSPIVIQFINTFAQNNEITKIDEFGRSGCRQNC